MAGPAKADVVLGVQWGDEGKGRVVDALAGRYDIVARFGGGDNAGHTLVVGDRKIALRIVPSGVFHEHTELFIGGGTVASLDGLLLEIEILTRFGVDPRRIKVSDRAHVVFPYHLALDRVNEEGRGAGALGTTGRGIGPAYTDRVSRRGITFGELRDGSFVERLSKNVEDLTDIVNVLRAEGEFPTDLLSWTKSKLPLVLPHVVDGVEYLHGALENGKRVLLEGAQGSLLDLGYGTYPYVTSSQTIAGGACTGLGLGPMQIGSVVGVAKAYCTRVGAGPFPSELHDETGARLRERGAEFGTVTGRPRRCGWFDAVAAHYAARINGLSGAIVTKLDVLTGLERIGLATGYRLDGKPASFGAATAAATALELDMTWFEGWREEISSCRKIANLPRTARVYLEALEDSLGVPIEAVSVGPEREELATA